MSVLHEMRSPRTAIQGQQKIERANGLKETYLTLPSAVNPCSCWWCSYFHHPTEQRRANIRQRIRFVCSFHGHTTRPETPGCEFFTAGGGAC